MPEIITSIEEERFEKALSRLKKDPDAYQCSQIVSSYLVSRYASERVKDEEKANERSSRYGLIVGSLYGGVGSLAILVVVKIFLENSYPRPNSAESYALLIYFALVGISAFALLRHKEVENLPLEMEKSNSSQEKNTADSSDQKKESEIVFLPTCKPKKKSNQQETLQEKLEMLNRDYQLIPHTRSSRSFSTVRRMKVEKELNIPIKLRASWVISTKMRKRANEMSADEWESFYESLCEELKRNNPELYQRVFPDHEGA